MSDTSLNLMDRGLKAAVERLLAHMQTGRLVITYPDGSQSHAGHEGGLTAEVTVRSMRGIQRIFTSGGGIGLAEAYMNREIDTPSLYNLLKLGLANTALYENAEKPQPIKKFAMRFYHWC